MATYCPEDGGDREQFSCPICFEDYDLQDARRAPKLLLCLHTFCYECTQKLWKNDGSLECSMCRMLHERVALDDLFENPVIVQHLKKEREEQDHELACKIDQELRNEMGGSPVTVMENNISEEHNDTVDDFSATIDILDSTDDNIEADETDLSAPEENSPRVSNMEEDQEVHERSDCQSNLFAELLESLRVSPHESRSDDTDEEEEEENGDEDENNVDDDIAVIHVNEDSREVQDDSSDDSNGDDSGNPIFCYNNIRELLGQEEDEDEDDDDEDDSENEVETNEEMNENPTFMMENFQCLFGLDNDDDDEDDERFHSACDDINTAFWGGDEDLPMHEGSEDDADTSAYCWQIVNPETLMDD